MQTTIGNAPGLSGPPDAPDLDDDLWSDAVNAVAARLVRDDDVVELVELLADSSIRWAVRNAIERLPARHHERRHLKPLDELLRHTNAVVHAECDRLIEQGNEL